MPTAQFIESMINGIYKTGSSYAEYAIAELKEASYSNFAKGGALFGIGLFAGKCSTLLQNTSFHESQFFALPLLGIAGGLATKLAIENPTWGAIFFVGMMMGRQMEKNIVKRQNP